MKIREKSVRGSDIQKYMNCFCDWLVTSLVYSYVDDDVSSPSLMTSDSLCLTLILRPLVKGVLTEHRFISRVV